MTAQEIKTAIEYAGNADGHIRESGSLVFVIPSPPSVNSLYYNAPGRGRRKTARYGAWRQAAGWAMKLDGTKPRIWATITGPVAIAVMVNSRVDADNNGKGICDLLVDMAVIADDSQVRDFRVIRDGAPAKQAIVSVTDLSVRSLAQDDSRRSAA